MDEPAAERERRTRQFEHYFGLMEHRALRLLKSGCFIVFSAPAPDEIRRRLGSARFAQYAFVEDYFFLDLPDTAITPEEAKRLLAERQGFAFALDRPQKHDAERQFDPLQRRYQYSERRFAAEEAAHIFFDVWQLPLDVWIKVHANAFGINRRWERGFSMG